MRKLAAVALLATAFLVGCEGAEEREPAPTPIIVHAPD